MTRYTSKNPRPIPLDYCKENLVVDPESPSGLRWLHSGTGRRKDLQAGSLGHHGYWLMTIDKTSYRVHRIIWALTHGPIPPDMVINHKDNDRGNNRLENLELLTEAHNARHTGKRGDNAWYPVGVSCSARGQTAAFISMGGRRLTSLCPTFLESTDPTSERLNDMCAKALEAFIERDGPDSPTVASFYSQLPIEAILGPAEGYP